MAPAFDVLGQLAIDLDGHDVRVDARGDTIVFALPGAGAALALLRRSPRGSWPAWLGRAQATLTAAGLTLLVTIAPATDPVARLGVGSRPTRISHLLRVGPLEVRAGPLLRVLSRRRVGFRADG